jgi:hypothetical protein
MKTLNRSTKNRLSKILISSATTNNRAHEIIGRQNLIKTKYSIGPNEIKDDFRTAN